MKYKNVISPKDEGLHFTKGYFDEGMVTITSNSMNYIACIFDRFFQGRYPESNLDVLHAGQLQMRM